MTPDSEHGFGSEPLLDRAFLDRQTFGDAGLAAELMRLFASQCDRLLPVMADTGQPRGVRADAAHTLKGAALAIGARRVAEIAMRIEAALGEAGETAGLVAELGRTAQATLAAA